MNVSAITSSQTFSVGNSGANSPESAISDEQKELISSVLAEYDPEDLSQKDAAQIASAFQEAGIVPSRELANVMSESGFSAREVGELAGVAGPAGTPPPPPPQDAQEIQSISNTLEILLSFGKEQNEDNTISEEDEEFISSLLSGYDSSNISQEDAIAIDSALKEAGIMPSRQLAEIMSESGFEAREIGDLSEAGRPDRLSTYESVSDYTSRIMNLTDDVKEDVKELFDSYSPQNTELTAQEASKVVINSLSQILADSNNYKSTSYYA